MAFPPQDTPQAPSESAAPPPADARGFLGKKPSFWLSIILGTAVLGAVVIPYLPAEYRQARVTQWWIYWLALGLALAVWWFWLSGLSKRTKLMGLWLLCGMAAVFPVLLKLDGTSGDLSPRFVWRFANGLAMEVLPVSSLPQTAPTVPPGAGDFLQFLGSNRNCRVPHVPLNLDWTQTPPKLLWKTGVGEAWSGFSVSGGYAITQEQRDDSELVVCYALATGKILWSHATATRFDDPLGGVGPRNTPTIVGAKVVTLGATGWLTCLDLASGKQLWQKQMLMVPEDMPEWGVSSSPLVFGDSVVVATGNEQGATLTSFSLATGARQWMIGSQKASYSSPILASVAGQETLLYFGPKDLTGHDPATGKQLWAHPWMPKLKSPHVAIPIVAPDGGVIVSSGYGKGSTKFAVSEEGGIWKTEEVWKTNRMKAKLTNLIEYQGHLYGLDDGTFACFDHVAGELKWKEGDYNHGQCLLIEPGLVLVTTEQGEVVLISPDPKGLREEARFQALDPEYKGWNPPALAGRYLLVRNNREAACYELPLKP